MFWSHSSVWTWVFQNMSPFTCTEKASNAHKNLAFGWEFLESGLIIIFLELCVDFPSVRKHYRIIWLSISFPVPDMMSGTSRGNSRSRGSSVCPSYDYRGSPLPPTVPSAFASRPMNRSRAPTPSMSEEDYQRKRWARAVFNLTRVCRTRRIFNPSYLFIQRRGFFLNGVHSLSLDPCLVLGPQAVAFPATRTLCARCQGGSVRGRFHLRPPGVIRRSRGRQDTPGSHRPRRGENSHSKDLQVIKMKEKQRKSF